MFTRTIRKNVFCTWKRTKSAMDVASRVRDWRPDPPTPSNRAFPIGCLRHDEIKEEQQHQDDAPHARHGVRCLYVVGGSNGLLIEETHE